MLLRLPPPSTDLTLGREVHRALARVGWNDEPAPAFEDMHLLPRRWPARIPPRSDIAAEIFTRFLTPSPWGAGSSAFDVKVGIAGSAAFSTAWYSPGTARKF